MAGGPGVSSAGLVLAFHADLIVSAVVLAVMTMIAVAAVKFIGSWLLRSAREDFHESVQRMIDAELGPIAGQLRAEISSMKAELLPAEDLRATAAAQTKQGLQIGWLMAAVRKVAEHVGLDIDEPDV